VGIAEHFPAYRKAATLQAAHACGRPVAEADLVIEAVFEDAQVKRSVIRRLEDRREFTGTKQGTIFHVIARLPNRSSRGCKQQRAAAGRTVREAVFAV